MSLTGKKSRSRPYSGFTLLELMLVAVIILTMAAVSMPLFIRTYDNLKLSAAAKEIVSVLLFCHDRAVLERRDFRMSIKSGSGGYRILSKDTGSDEFIRLKSRWGRVFNMPQGITIKSSAKEIDFYADGTSSGATAHISDMSGRTIKISVDPGTGVGKIYDIEKQ